MTARDVVLDASYKGIPYGVATRLADLGSHGWNVPAGDLPLPVMTLDRAAVENNIAAMAAYCARHGVRLAPHGKTTMSPQLFRRQLDAGAWAITAATPGQAALMRDLGIGRILLANELVDPNALRWLAGVYRRDPAFELLFLVDHPAAVRLADEVPTGTARTPGPGPAGCCASAMGRWPEMARRQPAMPGPRARYRAELAPVPEEKEP